MKSDREKGDSKNECEVDEEIEEKHRMWIDYPEDDNCALKAIEKHGPMTLEQISKRLGVSIVRVSQIEKQALKKLSKRIKI
ncbi:MAG: sigma factor-like helix-turn-helix DNA-binding protein [Actinomycetota bacterium]|nr:sigma factor-like helix-turn-helix DNA-binding protein [Actinomycetota bacterium]